MNSNPSHESEEPPDYKTCWPFPDWTKPRPALPAPPPPPPPDVGDALF